MMAGMITLILTGLSRLETSSAPVSRWLHAGLGRRQHRRYGDVKARKGRQAQTRLWITTPAGPEERAKVGRGRGG